jgi:TolB-like protein/DNA-binding winged helix-turn-helix (wHTH) protein/Tfp pilus assembly protein PilF
VEDALKPVQRSLGPLNHVESNASSQSSQMRPPDVHAIRVGAWRVDPTLDEISKDGTSVKLEPRTMRLLVCLAEHAGQVLSVEQLLDHVWKDVVVTPNSVYHAIAELRRVLGDDPKEPSYIANVVRRGYRLVAPVAPWVDELAVLAPDPPAPTIIATTAPLATATTRSPFRLFRIAAGLVLLAMLVLGYFVADKLWLSKRTSGIGLANTPASMVVSNTSIAVLPFVDMSEKKDQEYFADGMTEEIIDRLSKVSELYVPARTSSFYFKGKQTKISNIASELGVAHVLEGSVRKSGNKLRITAQLIRADNGYHLWSETFDRELDDVFQVQDEIAGAVVRALKVSLLEGTVARQTPTSSTEAYTLYLQARSIALRAGQADYEAAIGYLRQALKLDPQFSAAWAELANDIVDEFNWIKSRPVEAIRAEAHKAAAQALVLDPNLSAGHLAMAKILYWIDWNWDGAEAELKKTLTLDPANSDALRYESFLAATLGRADQSLQLAQSAVARDPLNSWNYFALGIVNLTSSARLPEAEQMLRKALELNPTGAGLHSFLGMILGARGEPAAALAEIDRETNDQFRETFRPLALDALGRTSEADRELAVVEKKYAERAPANIAFLYACRNDLDRAFAWFDRAYRQHDSSLADLKAFLCTRNLEPDPRYKALLRKMNLPD